MNKKILPAVNIALLLGMLGVTVYIFKRVREIDKFLFDSPVDDRITDEEFPYGFDDDDIDDDEILHLADEFDDDYIKNAQPTEE